MRTAYMSLYSGSVSCAKSMRRTEISGMTSSSKDVFGDDSTLLAGVMLAELSDAGGVSSLIEIEGILSDCVFGCWA